MSTPLSHTARILKLLKARGKVSNFELRKVAWRYPARILDLKKEGHRIRSVHDEGTRWFYIYEGHEDDEEELKKENN
ncbi:hypothetical protein Z045_05885 [Rhodococcus pyridinivorans KG-16]|uniref:Winged helix-turn-helix domain-containing protein n=1 Tax=Rhodococcus pyridinivorans KG-16 TaxID=1441730 RepID=A0A0V9UNX3_9NOCA|nr:helix-turn-helix domain-containing protein [Rhodococcus pyridinivorans]KSZ59696.1 hypothetical protein Z045_05885 [Rhodococcus pyridinivorans KG-16]